jgi:peptidoglycan hydrolase-like protein with peptidoglycan-binding domain
VKQLENEIWPEIARIVTGASTVPVTPPLASVAPEFPLPEGQYYGLKHYAGIPHPEEGLRLWQRQMVHRGWTLNVNGQFNEDDDRVTRQFQREKGLGVDGKVGLQTWNAAWNLRIT